MPKALILRINMTHEITAGKVIFEWSNVRCNNALDQLEKELERIVEEEVTFRLAARQAVREEDMRCE